MDFLRARALWLSFILLTTLFFSFQNCTPVRMSEDPNVFTQKSENGGPYSGVQKIYQYLDPATVCLQKDLRGQSLPNLMVIFKPNATGALEPYLARENCSDLLIPTLISASDLEVIPGDSSRVIYKGQTLMAPPLPGDFDIVAAQCPAGRTEIPAALRTNLVTSSLDWTVLRNQGFGWVLFPGVKTELHSTIQSLPSFLIERTDPANLEQYKRPTQYFRLKPSTQYAYSFVAKANATNGVDLNIYRGATNVPGPADETLLISFDFQTQSIVTRYSVNWAPYTATIVPFGNAYLCTVYFTTSAVTTNPNPMDIGISPAANGQNFGQLGDSIVATAAQLVEVNQYCQ